MGVYSLLVVYFVLVVVVECLAGITDLGRAPHVGETPSVPLLAPLLLSPTLWHFLLQVLSEMVLDTLFPVPVAIFPVGVTLRPVPPALPHLGAGAGDGASQGGIKAARMSRHVGCERVVLGVCLS